RRRQTPAAPRRASLSACFSASSAAVCMPAASVGVGGPLKAIDSATQNAAVTPAKAPRPMNSALKKDNRARTRALNPPTCPSLSESTNARVASAAKAVTLIILHHACENARALQAAFLLGGGGGAAAGACDGRWQVTVVPRPGSELMATQPPCISMNERT